MGKLLLQRVDAGTEQGLYLGMPQQLFHAAIGNAFLFGIFLDETIYRDYQGRDEFPSIGNDGNLVDVAVDAQLGLQRLRADILPVGRLEQVFDALCQIEMVVFQIAGIARMEPSVFVDGGRSGHRLIVIAGRNGLPRRSISLFSPIFTSTSGISVPTEPIS